MMQRNATEVESATHLITKIYPIFLEATIEHIRVLVKRHLPQGEVQDFILWVLAENNPCREEYLQITGINKTSELAAALVSDLFDVADLEKFAFNIGVINTYFTFEVISDNLAIGLASYNQHEATYNLRKELLVGFDNTMQKKLAGEKTATIDLLSSLATTAKTISCYEQSLAVNEIKHLVEVFQKEKKYPAGTELEHSMLSYLTLNIEACVQIVNLMADHPFSPYINKSLANRYSAVNYLMNATNEINLGTLTNYGVDTILVVPTLLYLIGSLDEINPNAKMNMLLQNGALHMAINSAACAIRLLNDIGPTLLNASDEDRSELKKALAETWLASPTETIFVFLEDLTKTKQFYTHLARLRKDIQYGEFNICLYNLTYASSNENALEQFFSNLKFFSELYQQQQKNILSASEEINQILESDEISKIILRMVAFHEKLYAKEFEHGQGDYATSR